MEFAGPKIKHYFVYLKVFFWGGGIGVNYCFEGRMGVGIFGNVWG